VALCSNCGRHNPEGALFCNFCAHALAGAAADAREERKIVTVLFADLVDFTARAERLDPEDVRAILTPYHTRLRAEIEAFGGTVEKFIGDAVMAVFGAPIAHGDDPERGVRAALAVRAAVGEMNAADPQLDLHVRLAVNTGEALVSLGAKAELGEGIVAGDVVNTASRLQTAAPIDGILVGEETYRATHGLVDYREVDPMIAKGKTSPVRVWLAVSTATLPGERIRSTVPMVGRVHESAVLHRILDGVVTERKPNCVTIIGEAGIGKTRLAAEFTGRVEQQGARFLRGRSLPYGSVTLYGPFSQHVKQFAGIFASDDAASAREKLRAAMGTLGVAGNTDEVAAHLALLLGFGSDGEVADRQILFFAARRLVEALAREAPTVLVFEDLHWADSGTLDLVELLASRVRDVPLMLLALARPDLLLTRPGWGGGLPAYTALSLETLSGQESRELAARLLGDEASASCTDNVVGTAEGNPLFIEELAASVVERPTAAGHLPTTIRDLVSARLDALPTDERSVLLDAAVVGRVFWRGALERMANDGANVLSALDALEARDLIRRESLSWIESEEQFSFKHVTIRDVAYATLPRAQRRERNAAVAAFLEEATGGAAATATALAQHWREAGDNERALGYLVRAADQAGRGWAKDEAAVLYRQALELVGEHDAEHRREISRKLALALQAAYHLADVRRLDAQRLKPEAGA
jgi:class 3 adenylate cyclase